MVRKRLADRRYRSYSADGIRGMNEENFVSESEKERELQPGTAVHPQKTVSIDSSSIFCLLIQVMRTVTPCERCAARNPGDFDELGHAN